MAVLGEWCMKFTSSLSPINSYLILNIQSYTSR